MRTMNHCFLAASCVASLLIAGQANAVDWLMLQGTEPTGAGAPAKIFGVLQPTYQADSSKSTAAEPTRVGPNLEKQEQFQLQRAILGVRGVAVPIDSDINYLVDVDFGSNAATDGGKYGTTTPVRLMDASVTLNHIPGARVRVGLFKTPGPEELLQGIPTMDYINFTDVSNQMMLERFPAGVNTYGVAGSNHVQASGTAPLNPNEASWTSSFGAARDMGLQVFDSFRRDDWNHSYALMIGNGNGVQTGSSIADGTDTYVYWASEKVYGGDGPRQQGLKMFAWHQAGKRKVDLSDDGVVNPVSHDRIRSGLGFRYRKGDWRLSGEYMVGEGMIFQGPEKPNFAIGSFQDLDGKANGYYLDAGYYVPNSKWQLDARYDQYNRSTEHQQLTVQYNTVTLGVNYHLNPKSRITVNYLMRDDEAKDPGMPAAAKQALKDIGDRLAVQVTMLY